MLNISLTDRQKVVAAIVLGCSVYIYFQLQDDTVAGEDAEDRKVRLLMQNYGVRPGLFDLDLEERNRRIKDAAEGFSQTVHDSNPGTIDRTSLEMFFFAKVREFEEIETARRTGKPRNRDSKRDEFPRLSIVNPGKVGDEVQLELVEGRTHTRITRAVKPPIFEIPDFLTPEECDAIIEKAKGAGLIKSEVFSREKQDDSGDRAKVTRVSQQAWLNTGHMGSHFTSILRSRLSRLTGLSNDVLDQTEPIQAVYYEPGGHYHAHLDSNEQYELTCCFQKKCENAESQVACCRICRYVTVLYYLNDVEEGGETAFPLADVSDEELAVQLTNISEKKHTWKNLSYNCHNASLVVKPRRGTAIMWYNHHMDENGYLGPVDHRSFHGGCDILKGHKWVANSWISAPPYRDRFIKSKYHWKSVVQIVES